jgi:hypothetical protein
VKALLQGTRRQTVLENLAGALAQHGLNDLAADQQLRRAEVAGRWWDNCVRAGLAPAAILDGVRQYSDLEPGPALEVVRELLDARHVLLPPERAHLLTRFLAHLPPLWRRQLQLAGNLGGTVAQAADLKPFLLKWAPIYLPGHRPRGVGDLDLQEYLGGGGFGEVYRAYSASLPAARPVVLKFCHAPDGARYLRHEARILDAIHGRGGVQGIVEVQATFCDNIDVPALRFPWIEGFTLQEILEARHRVGRVPTANFVIRLLGRAAQVLKGLHNYHYVHRDVKPSNLLLRIQHGGGYELYLIDFGIAGPAGQFALEEWELGVVTRQVVDRLLANGHSRVYASPQQLNGDPCNPNDDVYSTAVVGIQCLTGDFVHRVEEYDWPDVLWRRGAPGWLIDLLKLCVDAQAHRRPTDGDDLLTRLEAH